MKDTLVPVIIFCLVLVVVAAFCTLAFAVYLVGSRLFMFPVLTPGMLVAVLPVALRQVFLPAVLLSLFFALARARRKPGLVFLTYLVLGGLAFMALFLGPRLAAAPLDAVVAEARSEGVVSPRDLDFPRRLIPLKDAFLYFDRREGASLVNGFIVDSSRPAPRIEFFDRAAVSTAAADGGEARTARLALPGGGRVLEPLAAESAPFAPDPTSQSLLGFFQALNERYIALAGEQSGAAVLVCLVFTLLVLSSSIFLHATRWPLANVFLTLLVLALVLAFYNFLVTQFLVEAKKIFGESFWTSIVPKGSPLAGVLGESFWLTVVPNGVLAFVSAVFFLFDFVFLPQKPREEPRA
ncbi:MAG: hypothetical protein JXD23_10540 [Spirochaetales bacterium]|nr:hypothetical protein [Spirochaetales bacterium]